MTRSNPFTRPKALTKAFRLTCSVLTALGLASCAHLQPKFPDLPTSLREACKGPDVDAVSTVGDLADVSLRQEQALQDCDAKRGALVTIIDAERK